MNVEFLVGPNLLDMFMFTGVGASNVILPDSRSLPNWLKASNKWRTEINSTSLWMKSGSRFSLTVPENAMGRLSKYPISDLIYLG